MAEKRKAIMWASWNPECEIPVAVEDTAADAVAQTVKRVPFEDERKQYELVQVEVRRVPVKRKKARRAK